MAERRGHAENARAEAICFTAGPKGAPFGAGVIHGWLVSDRQSPIVAAGISTGALTAAAMQQCYRELSKAAAGKRPEREAARWTWFRRYLHAVTHDPLEFLWRAFPDPVDFAADQPPVTDLSCGEALKDEEARARRHYYLLTQLGIWLARLPIRVSTVARVLVYFVRSREGYGGWLRNRIGLAWAWLQVGCGLLWHIARAPRWFPEGRFSAPSNTRRFRHPLFGWAVWIGSVVVFFSALCSIPALALLLFAQAPTAAQVLLWSPVAITAAVLIAVILASASKRARAAFVPPILKHVFAQLDLSENLLNPYQLHRQLLDLFGDRKVEAEPMDVLLVAADLQSRKQCFAQHGDQLVEALMAALAIPGLFPPERPKDFPADLIDGAAIRQNPLPGLFRWLQLPENRSKAARLEDSKDASIYVVYNVPIEPYNPKPGEGEIPIDIVEAAFASLELARRRDTRQEVLFTNFTAALARSFRGAPSPCLKISAHEIAPSGDIAFKNSWDPKPKELLAAVAGGCKATLERVLAKELLDFAGASGKIGCHELLRRVAESRLDFITVDAPGLPEVCAECPRLLEHKPTLDSSVPAGVTQSFGIPGGGGSPGHAQRLVEHGFAHLRDDKPRIVFVASGGVFRGAFHIGTIGALFTCRVKPDLVVGASVGTLMGGALAAIFSVDAEPGSANARTLLHELTQVFLHVDERVALTKSLKNALKQLSVRSRRLRLSPSQVRRMMVRGSRADAGYAATGAPPALIDAISDLFLIPYAKTTAIAGDFVAGHFAEAVDKFLQQVRRETLPGLDIEYALMGTSLLEGVARGLLGARYGIHMDLVQPYHTNGISFFATTSYINRRMPLLLGRDFLTDDPSYDFVMAGLGSSAFPSVFSPRTEAEVVPGRGRTDVYFADGGMFDNLPFVPAIKILQAVQQSERSGKLSPDQPPSRDVANAILSALRRRTENPDLFIAAGLDADPRQPPVELDTLIKIRQRASSLAANEKIDSFMKHAARTQSMLHELIQARYPDASHDWIPEPDDPIPEQVRKLSFLDGVVNASILKVLPADPGHINGTFAFSRSTGMEKERIQLSIADGCYQTLRQISGHAPKEGFGGLPRGLKVKREPCAKAGGDECGWFVGRPGDRLKCPFAQDAPAEVAAIRAACIKDKAHRAG